MNNQEEIINTIKVLRKEVEVLTSRIKQQGTGHLHTAIGVINGRIDELIKEVTAPYFNEEDVYDGYEQHTEAMEQARLRRIQDSAAGRKPNEVRDAYLWSANKEGHWSPDDDVKHTKEYYDTERNKPMEGEDFQNMTSVDNDTWGGLSNRSMKQKHGQAVMTTSEMMQDELEPLPINTFE